MKEVIIQLFLYLHIVTGGISLLTGLFNIIRRKGDGLHKRIGRIFFISSIIMSLSALLLSWLNPNAMLFIIGIFTFYMTMTGQRAIRKKAIHKEESKIDWVFAIGMFLTVVVFFVLGVKNLLQQNMMGIVFIAFGLIGLLFVRTDLRVLRNQSRFVNPGMLNHIQRMTGSFIASCTAFLVVNFSNLPFSFPPVIAWLLPTAILVPFIFRWSNQRGIVKVRKVL